MMVQYVNNLLYFNDKSIESVEPQCNGGIDMKKHIENQWFMFIFANRTVSSHLTQNHLKPSKS